VSVVVFGLSIAFVATTRAQTPPTAQTPQTPRERPPLGAVMTAGPIGALPAAANLFSLLDTLVPDVIADRIDAGGTGAESPARVGAHGSTWTQTVFRVGDADITSLSGSGTPLLMPGVDVWEHIEVATGLMPLDVSAPGMAVTLMPRRPGELWTRSLQLMGAPPAFSGGSATASPPTITRLGSFRHANVFMSGPLVAEKLGALVSANWIRSSYYERSHPAALDASLGSAFVNLTSTPTPSDEIRMIGWGQRTRDAVPNRFLFNQPAAGEQNLGLHGQAAWQHGLADGDAGFRAFGSYTLGRRTSDLVAPRSVIVERLDDGPVPALVDAGVGTDRTWSAGARLNRSAGAHAVLAGVDLAGGSTTRQSTFAGRVGELVNGLAARIWDFTDPAAESLWRQRSFAAFVGDTAALGPRLTINGGLRFESIRGSAASHDATISWHSLLPRAGFHWWMLDFWQLSSFGQYGRYAHRLPLADLAYGDPTAPTANVSRWTIPAGRLPTLAALATQPVGPVIQRLGPGSAGDASFSSIDPALKRPYMDELVLGFEARPRQNTFLRIAAIGRLEDRLVGVVDVGVPASTYTIIGVPDMGIDVPVSGDDQILRFYNRSPATYGADRYLLTNPSDHAGSFVGVDMIGTVRRQRYFFLWGLTAGRSEGLAANRGFGPLENDAGLLGEVFVNPNARGFAQGRVFTERGYTVKLSSSYQFPRDTTFGLIGRYQDGQHFARLVVLPGLNQGAEANRAFRNGRTRFTFTMTVDARLQKGFAVGGHRMTAIVDAYNVFNQFLQIEEIAVSGATSRQTSAIQPPIAVHVGIRIPF
jgi:TonB dependent receptor-like, beta-barrel